MEYPNEVISMKEARDVDDCLAAIPAKPRATLQKLRKTIRVAAPKAVETISYGIPSYRYLGLLVGFAAFKDHCSFYVMSPSVMEAHRDELKQYDTAKGTIRFPIDKPPPITLVKKLVKARINENEAMVRKRKRVTHGRRSSRLRRPSHSM